MIVFFFLLDFFSCLFMHDSMLERLCFFVLEFSLIF